MSATASDEEMSSRTMMMKWSIGCLARGYGVGPHISCKIFVECDAVISFFVELW